MVGQLDRMRLGDPFDETAAVRDRADEISLAHHHPVTGHLLLALLESEAAELVPDAATLRERVPDELRTVPAAWSWNGFCRTRTA